jgi:hypothetical protein
MIFKFIHIKMIVLFSAIPKEIVEIKDANVKLNFLIINAVKNLLVKIIVKIKECVQGKGYVHVLVDIKWMIVLLL